MHRVGTIRLIAAIVVSGALFAAAPARAQTCPGNPDALGTSRVLPIKFGEYTRLGRMQYPDTLPLADHEVVITFDDGPRPLLSDKVLDILASQCVKVTYFIIGQMAHYFPDIVRREYAAGHSIGTHSEDHPLRFDKLSDQKVQWEIDQGIASVGAALGDPDELSPFFRIPGLGRTKVVEQELAKRSLIVFSADVVADDWFRHIKPDQIIQRAMSRLEKRGNGILLLHDIHPATVLALPGLLKALKENGFRIVHVVPAEPSGPRIAGGPTAAELAPTIPQAGLLADKSGLSPAWPQPNVSPAAADSVLPAPDEAALSVEEPLQIDADLAEGSAGIADWPKLSEITPPASAADLPVLGLRAIGVSLRGERLVGAEVTPPPRNVAAVNKRRESSKRRAANTHRVNGDHGRVHHARLRERHPARRAGVDHHRADLLSEMQTLAALLTPATTHAR